MELQSIFVQAINFIFMFMQTSFYFGDIRFTIQDVLIFVILVGILMRFLGGLRD